MTHAPTARPTGSNHAAKVSAFTLVELLVVIAIIGVLIGILIPVMGNARNSARKTATTSLMTAFSTSVNQFRAQNNRLPGFFSQAELGQSSNDTGFTAMENALLDLAGGLKSANQTQDWDLGAPGVFELTIAGKTVRINSLAVGGEDGPGFLNLGAKFAGAGNRNEAGADVAQGGWQQGVSGLAPARPGTDQDGTADIFTNTARYQMPDLIDSWGKPVLLWVKNEAAGTSPPPAIAGRNAPAISNLAAPQSLFYWRSNHGYLGAPLQRRESALGELTGDTQLLRTMNALLGNPSFADASAPGDEPAASTPLGDFVLQSAGIDSFFLANRSRQQFEYRYLPKGTALPASWGGSGDVDWSTIDRTDDVIQGGN
jgi:prepilin-type N-terminal cleavage/methylation domain-containing protein